MLPEAGLGLEFYTSCTAGITGVRQYTCRGFLNEGAAPTSPPPPMLSLSNMSAGLVAPSFRVASASKADLCHTCLTVLAGTTSGVWRFLLSS
jgi:hypothetical protein